MPSSWTSVFPESRGSIFWLAIGCVLIALVALVDVLTGPELAVSLFYLIPVVIVTWFAGKRSGIVTSVIAAIGWFFADMLAGHTYSLPLIGYWNAGIRFGFFVIVALLLPALKELEREKQLSRIDPLTGTSNLRHLIEAAQSELFRSQQTRQAFSVAYMDLDGFKAVNDQHGHAAGDKLLKVMVARIRTHLRAADIIARVGGDEFVLLLPETDEDGARFIMNGVLSAVRNEMRQHNWTVGFSIGTLTYKSGPADVEDLLARADALMYRAKRSGSRSIEHGVYAIAPIVNEPMESAAIYKS